jgi:hypothetical protein
MVEGESGSSAFRCNLPVNGLGRVLGGMVELTGFETCLRPLAGLSYCPYCLKGPDAAFRCGLALGEWSMSWREALEGDICCAARPDRAAPLLARFRRATGECALASVDCDHRLRLPNPSPAGFSNDSSALLLLLRVVPPPTRRAISDTSPGLCEPIGSTELRALSPGEVSEPARLIVVAVEPEDDLGRVDRRLDGGALARFPVAETDALLPCIMASALETGSRRTAVFDHAPLLQPYSGAPKHVARTLTSCTRGQGTSAGGLIREVFCYTESCLRRGVRVGSQWTSLVDRLCDCGFPSCRATRSGATARRNNVHSVGSPVSIALRLLVVVCSSVSGGCACRCRCVERGWVYGLVSSCLVSFRLRDRQSRSDENVPAVRRQYPGLEGRCCGTAIPGQTEEQRILESEMQAGPRRERTRAQYAGSTQRTGTRRNIGAKGIGVRRRLARWAGCLVEWSQGWWQSDNGSGMLDGRVGGGCVERTSTGLSL